jgi:hypothetical protein
MTPGLLSVLFVALVAPPQQAPNERAADLSSTAKRDSCCSPTPAPSGPLPMDRKSVALRELADRLEPSDAPYFGLGALARAERQVDALPKDAPAPRVYNLHFSRGDLRLDAGEVDGALEDFQRCLEIARATKDLRGELASLKRLGLTWFRSGERANCVTNHNQDSCIAPLRGGAIHRDRTGSERAMEYFERALAIDGGDLGTMWLLNVAAMTLGQWPDLVPKPWRISPNAFTSERAMPRMPDVAKELGIAVSNHAGGSAMDDFDGDGLLDVMTSGAGLREPMHFFRQQPDGTFRDVAAEVGLAGQTCSLNFAHFDANHDGRLDLLIQRGAWMHDFGRLPNSLMIQQPDGTFVDRTLEAGLEISAPSQVAAVADVDLDGDLDVFLGYERSSTEPDAYPSHLFLNRGDGTFEDVTERAGVANHRYCKGAVFGDYDGDGLPDLYVSNLRGQNRLYHNDGGGHFTDVAEQLGVDDPFESFSCFFFDYDQDGDLDLYCSCYDSRQRQVDVGAWYRNGTTGSDTQRLYENDGHGGFRDVTVARAMNRTVFPMGSNFGDLDNDGYPDVYLATGDPDFASVWPNVLLHNDRGRKFEDVTSATGTGHLQKGHGVSWGDYDGDGDQDLFVEIGGAVKDDAFHDALFQNPGHGNHWLTVRLVGHASNRFGVGSRVKATIEEPTGRRDVYTFVGGNSSFGGNSLQAEMGLGQASRLVALEVFWPRTHRTQRFEDVPLDRVVVVDEDAGWRLVEKPNQSTTTSSSAGSQ